MNPRNRFADWLMSTDDPTVEVKASFRLMGVGLEPDVVTQLMGVEPESAHRKGEARQGRARGRLAPFREGLWSYSAKSEGRSLEEQLDEIIQLIRPRSERIKELVAQGMRADVFVGIFSDDANAAFTIEPLTLERLADLELRLELDIYFVDRP